ncbi:hypothetical protein BDP27DRAFT_1434429 [Rhodocollybia butyracea]|uniref:3-deoxy-7-phosphoheptulonate synthase n=1 Tax=Rhodocollybia butyracea TaxID=206335 RepID=A0A9P5P7A6_9AGAR|nr:hypothetical protein BDP27DRAFT_1434429 [Rhodocollybia butyracea]
MVRPLILHSRYLAIPDEDKYDASPFPDFDDDDRVQQFLQDRRVIGYDPLVQPALLRHEITSSAASHRTIASARFSAAKILSGHDDRILVIVGPCSIHSPEQALEYARLLKAKMPNWPNLLIIMRAYLCRVLALDLYNIENRVAHDSTRNTRTTVGWKGLINDPDINGTFKINKGLRTARQLLCDLTDLGVPVGSELLDTISPQYISDLISWGAIGARTTESQLHRELASGVSFPIGFKNGTDGSVAVAIDAMHSASNPHAFMGVTEQGLASIVKTRGNQDVHVILRGGTKGPNYASEHIKDAAKTILKKRTFASIMVDCSQKSQQPAACDIGYLYTTGRWGRNITGVMIESNINDGRQDVPSTGPTGLKHGISITDACVDFDTTLDMLDKLNEAVSKRRAAILEAGMKTPAAFESNGH